jgi:hypothetical protein
MIIRNKSTQNHRTIIVAGVARSGTSLVTHTLHNLGVYLGEKLTPGSFEDLDFARKIKSSSPDLKQTVSSRNIAHQHWGFKLTSGFDELLIHPTIFDSPIVLVPIRDVTAILKRRNMARDKSLEDQFSGLVKQQTQLFDFLEKAPYTQFIFSYQQAINDPEKFVQQLIECIGLSVTEGQLKDAVEGVSANTNTYTQAFFDNHSAKFETEVMARNDGEIAIGRPCKMEKPIYAAWGISDFKSKKNEEVTVIKPTVKSIKKHSANAPVMLITQDVFKLAEERDANKLLWHMRQAYADQERVLRIALNKRIDITLKSSEKLNLDNVQDRPILNRLKNGTVQSMDEERFAAKLTNEFGVVSGWVYDKEQSNHLDFILRNNEEKIMTIKNDQPIKTKESKILGVSKFGVSAKLGKDYTGASLSLLEPATGTVLPIRNVVKETL